MIISEEFLRQNIYFSRKFQESYIYFIRESLKNKVTRKISE